MYFIWGRVGVEHKPCLESYSTQTRRFVKTCLMSLLRCTGNWRQARVVLRGSILWYRRMGLYLFFKIIGGLKKILLTLNNGRKLFTRA